MHGEWPAGRKSVEMAQYATAHRNGRAAALPWPSIAKGRTRESEPPQRSSSARQCSLRCERSDSEGGPRQSRSMLPEQGHSRPTRQYRHGTASAASRTGPAPPAPPEQGHRPLAPLLPAQPASAKAPGNLLPAQLASATALANHRSVDARGAGAEPSGPAQPPRDDRVQGISRSRQPHCTAHPGTWRSAMLRWSPPRTPPTKAWCRREPSRCRPHRRGGYMASTASQICRLVAAPVSRGWRTNWSNTALQASLDACTPAIRSFSASLSLASSEIA